MNKRTLFRSLVMSAIEGKLFDCSKLFHHDKPIQRDDSIEKLEIPSNWLLKPLDDVTICLDGNRIPVKAEIRATREKIYDYYGASGVIDKIDNYIFNKRLLLIGEDGANLLTNSKPNAFIADGKYWVNNHAHVFDENGKIVLDYLAYFINAISLAPYVTGTAQPKLTQKKLLSILIPLPSIEEQKYIVAKIDEMCTYFEIFWSAHEQLTELNKNLPDRLRASLLQEAISGRLVEQRDDEPAVEQIGDAPEDVPFAIPEKWKWVTLRDVGRIVSGGTPKTSIAEYWQGGKIPWITPADLGKNRGNQFISHGEKYITQKGLDNSSAQKMPRGSVIFSSRAPIGYVAIAENALCTNQGCKSVVNSDKYAISEWIYYSLICRTPDIQSRASGTTFREISGGKFGETWIPLPPLAEQRRIVARLEELLPEVATLKG